MIEYKKAALIIGHPGHELKAFKFIKDFKPDVFIITDGSGANNVSRMGNSIKIIESLGARLIKLFEPLSDREIYTFIKEGNISEISKIKEILSEKIINENYDLIIGDALEGFNPTHDLCRYIINSIVKEYQIKLNREISNYSFDLDKAPNDSPLITKSDSSKISFELNELELEQKYNVAIEYPELKFEVEKVLQLYGKEAFKLEFYTKISDPHILKNWDESSPKYEKYGKERVKDGLYKEVIEFEKHMRPIAQSLLNL